MKVFNLSRSFLILSLLSSIFTHADVSLPIHTLRDQGSTEHCWAYAMSHMLETRALIRDSNEVLINTEKDVKYWVDYERMMYIHRSKANFYLGDYEGGWQIEFFESALKHGKNFLANNLTTPKIPYQTFKPHQGNISHRPEPRPKPDYTLPSWEVAGLAMRTAKTELEAHNYAIDYLTRKYGAPQMATVWSGRQVPVADSAKLILAGDFNSNSTVDALVLVKPVTDGNFGWVPYLENRYWGYRYDKAKILQLIEYSLNNKWPVTFDNVYHAMTIVGFATDQSGNKHYAVADSIPGKITWYGAHVLYSELNLVTFFKAAIPNALPPRTQNNLLQVHLPFNKTIDQIDNLTYPPR